MTQKTKKKRNSVTKSEGSTVDRVVGRYRTNLRFTPSPHSVVFSFKTQTTPEIIFSAFPKIFNDGKILDRICGPAFPQTVQDIFCRPGALQRPAKHLQEIVWSICRCLQYGNQLSEFLPLKGLFETSVLLHDQSACRDVLTEIEGRFGQSTWLIQAQMCAARHWGGISELNLVADSYQKNAKLSPLLTAMLWFFRRRIDGSSVEGHLKGELAKFLNQMEGGSVQLYLETKLFELPDVSPKSVGPTLFYEAQSSLIDLYESLVLILQSMVSDSGFPEDVLSTLSKPVSTLLRATGDLRLPSILRALGVVLPADMIIDSDRAAAIETYTAGQYEESLQKATDVLKRNPSDMSIFVLHLKACLHLKQDPPPYAGVLQKIAKNMTTVLKLSEGTYSAAHELIILTGRFYGQAWMHYIRAAVMYEIRQEKDGFPPTWLRDLFIRDCGVSPFSTVAAATSVQNSILNNPILRQAFPITFEAFEAVTTGKVSARLTANSQRQEKYLARFNLTFGDPKLALQKYNELLRSTTGADAIRCAGGAALAYLKLGLIKEAVDTTVTAYLGNKNAPSTLPILTVANALNHPKNWPNSIAVPILLELYLEYCGLDRFADLRYSFECFQEKNLIKNPSDLLKMGFTIDMVCTYLDRVWRPEVMRQTLLYASSKEIEEARVRVCQTLAEVDKENESKYLDEIKERVKRLEIAKGTTLVEQSKVYVDIQAIKKAIRSKLTDSYARYKTSSTSNQSERDLMLERVADVVSQSAPAGSIVNILSKVHLLDAGSSSEADAQFDAMYAEVTNEFLRGAHGLNAYLSTRIRHGTLSNTLRKPVEDERLVTSKQEGRKDYLRNESWLARREDGDDTGLQTVLSDALSRFSFEFDSVLDDIRDNLLQIRIENGIAEGGKERALFVYRSSNIERIVLKERDRSLKDVDQFVDRCVDHLWQKTDECLAAVQNELGGVVRQRLTDAFDSLVRRLEPVQALSLSGELINAIARARTNTQARLTTVVSWFKRSEVYDRQDYTVDFPIDVAVNMIRNTISSASNWTSVHVTVEAGSQLMPGRTLDGMVYAFYGLLENAIKRSKVNINELVVDAKMSFKNDLFEVRVSNNVNLEKTTMEDRDRIEQIRSSIKSQESPRRAQSEGLSGLHKVWLTANGPFYRVPELDFGIEDNLFFVSLRFSIEKVAYEVRSN